MNMSEYPVTRLQAAKWLRTADRLECSIEGERTVQVMIRFEYGSKKIACRMWSGGGVWWTKLSWKQLLGFIRRNYVRNYEGLS